MPNLNSLCPTDSERSQQKSEGFTFAVKITDGKSTILPVEFLLLWFVLLKLEYLEFPAVGRSSERCDQVPTVKFCILIVEELPESRGLLDVMRVVCPVLLKVIFNLPFRDRDIVNCCAIVTRHYPATLHEAHSYKKYGLKQIFIIIYYKKSNKQIR